MKSIKMLTILALALGLMAWQVEVSEAAPMGTAFTYQGRLMDANVPADGLYDLQFSLFPDPVLNLGQIGPPIDVNDIDIIDGYFTVELDFGNKAFGGDARWLQIGVRPWDSDQRHTILSPRQEVTPTPYALYAQNASTDNDWMVSGSDMYSIPSGNIGIGTNSPDEKLTVAGTIKASVLDTDGIAVNSEAKGEFGVCVFGKGSGNYSRGGYFMGYIGVFAHGESIGGDFQAGNDGIAVDAIVGVGSGKAVQGWGPSAGYDFYAIGPGTNYGAESSIRWKNNICPIDEPLKKVMSLRGVYFDWDAEHGGQHDVGMIAEEVGQVLPEIVQYEEDGIYTSGMDYSKLTPLLVESVKELKGENDRLKERLVALERIIQQLAKGKMAEL